MQVVLECFRANTDANFGQGLIAFFIGSNVARRSSSQRDKEPEFLSRLKKIEFSISYARRVLHIHTYRNDFN